MEVILSAILAIFLVLVIFTALAVFFAVGGAILGLLGLIYAIWDYFWEHHRRTDGR